MAIAKRLFTKTDRESKSAVIDCSPALADGETIDTIGVPVVTPAGLTVTGVVTNADDLSRAGESTIPANGGLQMFLNGGTDDTVYVVTVPYTTSDSQDLDASIRIKVVNDV